jgi:hypothetical protein
MSANFLILCSQNLNRMTDVEVESKIEEIAMGRRTLGTRENSSFKMSTVPLKYRQFL